MHNHFLLKTLALVLAMVLICTAAVSGFGILALNETGLYRQSVEDAYLEHIRSLAQSYGNHVLYHELSQELGGATRHMTESYYGSSYYYGAFRWGKVGYIIRNEVGEVISDNGLRDGETMKNRFIFPASGNYLKIHDIISVREDETFLDGESAEASVPAPVPEETAEAVQYSHLRYFDESGTQKVALFTYEPMPAYTVEVVVAENALYDEFSWVLMGLLYHHKSHLLPVLGISLVLLLLCAVYLCCAAGRKPGTEDRRAGGLNRFPLDGYLALAICGICAAAVIGVEGAEYLLEGSLEVALSLAGAMLFAAAALLTGFCFAFVAQIKTPDGFWWKNTLFFRCLDLSVKLCLCGVHVLKWLWHRLVPLAKDIWNLFKGILRGIFRLLGSLFCGLWKLLDRFVQLLPLTWQWLLGGGAMAALLLIAFASRNGFFILLSLGCCAVVILYGTQAFGVLLEAVKRMSRGDLEKQVDSGWLLGSFREFADALNSLAGVAVVAAQKQLKSERMKTELITNVSHDIKTPLTSIINYVDLLEKPHTEEEKRQYLEVLSRQSLRLKKLIEDLMEMSKASTGNMAVEIRPLDAAEAINQALGEFSDKLEKARLTPVFRQPEAQIRMMADGTLTWRVLSNLLSNAVKYALPGTRLYLDLAEVDGKVVISLKNISREELNVEAEELLERFVRGDLSRNTEGSGLGLNIAQSLMQLQKGSLQIVVDGDLFKVTLVFPGVES